MNAMHQVPDVNREQAALWNGAAAHAWADEQALLDRMFQPFEDLLVETAVTRGASRVLDIGCGTGATTLAIARGIGTAGECTGVDISEPLLVSARARAAHEKSAARFVLADAQAHAFAPTSVDLVVSRFGVMFFDDPVAAFTNLRRTVREGGSMRVIAFRSVTENPFMTTAERAVGPLLPNLPPRQADAPGQFAFADEGRVRGILTGSGWRNVDIEPLDVHCVFPAQDLSRYVTRFGPVGLVLQQADERTRTQVLEKLGAAFAPYVAGGDVRFTAACWSISAETP